LASDLQLIVACVSCWVIIPPFRLFSKFLQFLYHFFWLFKEFPWSFLQYINWIFFYQILFFLILIKNLKLNLKLKILKNDGWIWIEFWTESMWVQFFLLESTVGLHREDFRYLLDIFGKIRTAYICVYLVEYESVINAYILSWKYFIYWVALVAHYTCLVKNITTITKIFERWHFLRVKQSHNLMWPVLECISRIAFRFKNRAFLCDWSNCQVWFPALSGSRLTDVS